MPGIGLWIGVIGWWRSSGIISPPASSADGTQWDFSDANNSSQLWIAGWW